MRSRRSLCGIFVATAAVSVSVTFAAQPTEADSLTTSPASPDLFESAKAMLECHVCKVSTRRVVYKLLLWEGRGCAYSPYGDEWGTSGVVLKKEHPNTYLSYVHFRRKHQQQHSSSGGQSSTTTAVRVHTSRFRFQCRTQR